MGTQLFDEVVGELPTSTVDVDGIVRREKRRGATRRVAGLATAVVALSVTTALGLTMTGGTGASSPPSAAGGASGGATSAAPDTRFALVADSKESAAATAKRLSYALDAAFRKEAPGAKWIFEPGVPGETGPSSPPKLSYKTLQKPRSVDIFAGDSGVLNKGNKGSLFLQTSPTVIKDEKGEVHRYSMECSPKAPKCVEGTAPNGAKTRLSTFDYGDGIFSYNADVILPDERVLAIQSSNDFGPDGSPAAQRAMPLTGDQVLAIAIDVASQIKAGK